MCKGTPTKHIPDKVYKDIIELSGSLSSRDISEEIKARHDYSISYSTITKLLKEVREERSEIFKSNFTEALTETLPNDLAIMNHVLNDLYADYQRYIGAKSDRDQLIKLKIARTITNTIDIKLKNCGAQQQTQNVNWEQYLKENEEETYKF